MNKKLYYYSNELLSDFLKQLLPNFQLIGLSDKDLSNKNVANKDIVVLINELNIKHFNQAFFNRNNVIVFYPKSEKIINSKINFSAKNYTMPMDLKKFADTVKNIFLSNTITFSDIKIVGESIVNSNSGLFYPITMSEKKIFATLVDQRKVERVYFLEKILELKKDLETKTVETHLSRIRKKLQLIKSKIKISSKDDIFFLED